MSWPVLFNVLGHESNLCIPTVFVTLEKELHNYY